MRGARPGEAGIFWRSVASDASGGRSQIFAQDFAERIFRQRVDELDALGALEAGQARATKILELRLVDLGAVAQAKKSLDGLPHSTDGTPITAHSSTAGWLMS